MNRNYSGDFELLTVASRFIYEAIAVAFTQKRAELGIRSRGVRIRVRVGSDAGFVIVKDCIIAPKCLAQRRP